MEPSYGMRTCDQHAALNLKSVVIIMIESQRSRIWKKTALENFKEIAEESEEIVDGPPWKNLPPASFHPVVRLERREEQRGFHQEDSEDKLQQTV